MAEGPGSYKRNHNLSRHTMVIRKAKDEDARRLAEAEESKRLADAMASHTIRRSITSRRDVTSSRKKPSSSQRMVTGRTVVVHREDGGASQRLTVVSPGVSGRQASVRVTGGDTIIRFQSGDMVVKRGARRARLRRQTIWAYAFGYLLLFGLYGYFLITGVTAMEPMEFVKKAFSRRHSSAVIDLERAALEAMRGSRTPAEIRLAEQISFYDENQDLILIAPGDRLTLLTAAKLGKAILADQDREESKRSFSRPLLLYRETYLANVNWPYWLTFYNATGFFLLLLLFLWRPLMNYLGTQGKKTAVALRNARDAQEEAEEYRDKYRELASDIEKRGDAMRSGVELSGERDLERALDRARGQASRIAEGIEDSLNLEARAQASRLGMDTARRACDRARVILEERLGQKEHDAAIDELIADIARARL